VHAAHAAYVRRLAEALGRTDVKVISAGADLHRQLHLPFGTPIVVDHAARTDRVADLMVELANCAHRDAIRMKELARRQRMERWTASVQPEATVGLFVLGALMISMLTATASASVVCGFVFGWLAIAAWQEL
jgi:hypothetical protein